MYPEPGLVILIVETVPPTEIDEVTNAVVPIPTVKPYPTGFCIITDGFVE